MKKLCIVIAGMLLAMSCTNVQKGKETENEQTVKTDTVLTTKSAAGNEDMAEPIKGDRFRVEIEKEKKDGNIETFCYAINPRTNEKRKVVFQGSEYDDWMNDTYWIICYYNLKEKWMCGGIKDEDWQKIEEADEWWEQG